MNNQADNSPETLNLIHKVDIYSNFVDPQLNSFFEDILTNLNAEFNLYLKHTKDTDLFDYNERVFIGFLTNAIIRNDAAKRFSTLQEYVVYKSGKNIGRADLMVYDSITRTYFIFEAKRKPKFAANKLIDWMNNLSTSKLTELVQTQAQKYYRAEESFFVERASTTYLCAVYFEIITQIDDPSQLSGKHLSELENTFYTVYYFDDNTNNGLAVYGLLIKSDKLL